VGPQIAKNTRFDQGVQLQQRSTSGSRAGQRALWGCHLGRKSKSAPCAPARRRARRVQRTPSLRPARASARAKPRGGARSSPGRRRRCRRLASTSSSMTSPVRTTARGPPAGALRRDVQHDGAEGRAGHAAVRHAHHVRDPRLEQPLGERHVADLRVRASGEWRRADGGGRAGDLRAPLACRGSPWARRPAARARRTRPPAGRARRCAP